MLDQHNFAQAFDELTQLLICYQAIWRPQPFSDEVLPWLANYSSLHEALLALSAQQLDAFEEEQLLLDWMAGYLPTLNVLNAWHITPYTGPLLAMAKFADSGIPGRKKQQIVAFSSAVCQQLAVKGPIVDWCSGKGHLARQLHQLSQQAVTCLEYDAKLCKDGEHLSTAMQCDVHFVQQDVLQAIDKKISADANLHTALHACGELHVQMLKTAVNEGSANIACAPCCYHLSAAPCYQPLSAAGKLSQLQLDKRDLRLAVLQTVTGGQRIRRLRQQELQWRIAFDLLQRDVTGVDQYRPCPSFNKQYLSGRFIDYAKMMVSRAQLTLPLQLDEQQLLSKAGQKYHRIIRLEKARLAFRKALEYWLLLDRVLYVQEQGYEVQLNSFCAHEVSPRNALILARRTTANPA